MIYKGLFDIKNSNLEGKSNLDRISYDYSKVFHFIINYFLSFLGKPL